MRVDGGKSANEQLVEDQALKNQDCWGMFVDNQNQCCFFNDEESSFKLLLRILWQIQQDIDGFVVF